MCKLRLLVITGHFQVSWYIKKLELKLGILFDNNCTLKMSSTWSRVFFWRTIPICKLHNVLLPNHLSPNFSFVCGDLWSLIFNAGKLHTSKYFMERTCDHLHYTITRLYLSRYILNISSISCHVIMLVNRMY